MEWSDQATGVIANLSNSAGTRSTSVLQFTCSRIAVMTSLRDGSSMDVDMDVTIIPSFEVFSPRDRSRVSVSD